MKLIFKVAITILVLSLYACGGGGGSDDNKTDSISNKITTGIPSDIQALISSGSGTLAVYVTVDGNTASRTKMSIDATGSGSASATLSNLTGASHTLVISYEYTDNSDTIVLASASNTVNFSTSSDTLSVSAGDYDLSAYDEDGDGISNTAELTGGSDPRDPSCVIGSSIVGGCKVG